jgi:cytochrome c-type biogenesis protein CcmH
MKKAANLLVFLLLASSALRAHPVVAQESTPSDDEVNEIARQLYCPVCENIPLEVCPTTACHQWRELIRQMLAEGKTATEIKEYFVENYGARVLSEPPRIGINWLIYLVPPAAFLLGAFLLIRGFHLWKEQPETVREPGTEIEVQEENQLISSSGNEGDEDYLAQIEYELKKRKQENP